MSQGQAHHEEHGLCTLWPKIELHSWPSPLALHCFTTWRENSAVSMTTAAATARWLLERSKGL